MMADTLTSEKIVYVIEYIGDGGPKRAEFSSYNSAKGYYEEKRDLYRKVAFFETRTTVTTKLLDGFDYA